MVTDITTTLTGKTVQVKAGTPVAMGSYCIGETFQAEVVSTWFSLRNTVEAIEIIHPVNGRRLQLWEGFSIA